MELANWWLIWGVSNRSRAIVVDRSANGFADRNELGPFVVSTNEAKCSRIEVTRVVQSTTSFMSTEYVAVAGSSVITKTVVGAERPAYLSGVTIR